MLFLVEVTSYLSEAAYATLSNKTSATITATAPAMPSTAAIILRIAALIVFVVI